MLSRIVLVALAFLTPGIEAAAQEPAAPLSWQVGPADIPLAGQATLRLPDGYRFLNAKDTQNVLKEMGNFPSGQELGLVAPKSNDDEQWFTVLGYVDAGYVKDDDAANWNADELFASIKEGTESDNAQRTAQGSPPLVLIGWEEKPHYDAAAHKVEWAISHEGSQGGGVNYNTLALGRHGYISMNMVGALKDLPSLKPHARTLLTHLEFTEGKRYADFDSATDTVAAVGLAALIAGAAFKSGILAKLWAFLIPIVVLGKKLIVFIIIGLAALARTWFKKKPVEMPQSAPPTA